MDLSLTGGGGGVLKNPETLAIYYDLDTYTIYIIMSLHTALYITNDDDRVSRSKDLANWTKLTPINTYQHL